LTDFAGNTRDVFETRFYNEKLNYNVTRVNSASHSFDIAASQDSSSLHCATDFTDKTREMFKVYELKFSPSARNCTAAR